MKKVNYLLAILFAVALLSTSCEKEDVNPDDPKEITTEDLVGNWDFVSLEFNGETYYGCDEDLNKNYELTVLDFKNVTTSKMTLFSDCMDVGENNWEMDYGYTLINNIIKTDNMVSFEFEIVNINTFNGTELKLKLKSPNRNDIPLNGIYTLEKN